MKVLKSGCFSGLNNKHPQEMHWLSDCCVIKLLLTEVQVVPFPDISAFLCFCATVALLTWTYLDLMLSYLSENVFVQIPQSLQISAGKSSVTEWWESVRVYSGACPLAVAMQLVTTLMLPHVEQTCSWPKGCAWKNYLLAVRLNPS